MNLFFFYRNKYNPESIAKQLKQSNVAIISISTKSAEKLTEISNFGFNLTFNDQLSKQFQTTLLYGKNFILFLFFKFL